MGHAEPAGMPQWVAVCALDDIAPETGVCALINEQPVAVFRVGEQVYAIDDHDPFSGANVLSRGLICSLGGRVAVASPIYKQHFELASGVCLEDASRSVRAYAARVHDGHVFVAR